MSERKFKPGDKVTIIDLIIIGKKPNHPPKGMHGVQGVITDMDNQSVTLQVDDEEVIIHHDGVVDFLEEVK